MSFRDASTHKSSSTWQSSSDNTSLMTKSRRSSRRQTSMATAM
jgi:hypothetical protein